MLILLYWSVQSQKSIREMDQKTQKILQLFIETLDVYDRKYDFEKAIEYFNKLVALNPKFAQAYHYRGVAYIDKGDFEKATEDLETAIALNEGVCRCLLHPSEGVVAPRRIVESRGRP